MMQTMTHTTGNEAEDDGIAPRVVRDVKTPTSQEMEEDNCAPIPSHPWCPACVAGKKPIAPHKRQTEGEHLVPEIGLDYAFLRETDSDETLTILVMKDRDSNTIFADVVEAKGRGLEGTVENVVRNIARLGYKKVTLCSDQEPAILGLIAGIIAARQEATISQNSPVGESQANGLVERAVRSVKDQVRTLRLALQKRVGCRIPVGHPIMAWIVKHAGELIQSLRAFRRAKQGPGKR